MSTDELAAEIVGRCRERIDAGENVDLDAIVRAHPEIAATLRDRFDALARLDRGFARRAAANATPLLGSSLGPWRLASVLGTGGMGTVFLARNGDERAAVKVIHAHLLVRQGSVERFQREVEIGRRVRHENVVATLDADAAHVDGHAVHFLVMEHVEGRTLRALLGELGRVPEELCRHVGREAAKALVAIHAAGAVHRDLKPDNVLITKDDAVKVMDLGAARLLDESFRVSDTGAFVGSVKYASPEQFGGPAPRGATNDAGGVDEVDGRADLYALGLTLYELSTGRHPFEGGDFRLVVRRQMTEVPRAAGELNPQLSPFYEDVLRCLLEKDRDARFASAAALLDVLEQGESSAWWHERAKSIRASTRRPLRRIRIPRETALHGRDAELASLRALFDAAKAGDGRVVLVEGEAGIGKSRLVDEFVGLLAQAGEDVNFLYGSYPPGGAATASGAFTSAYREHLGDDDSAVRAALPQTPLLVPAFAALLRGDVAPAGSEPLTKDSLQTAFVHATRSFATQRPTIVLIDDLHFAPDEGRALFASLALAVPGHRVLVVGTSRPEIDAKWVAQVARGEHVSRVRLPRLGAKDLVLLLRDSLRSDHLAEELAAKIAVKSDGNPFFVFEILRGLRDGQFLTRRPDGTWATTKLIAEIEVPGSVKELIFARVGNLSTVERSLLDVAACAGFEFDPVLVGEVLQVGRIPVLQRLAAIEMSHRLVRSAGRRFAFDHHQIAEVLYAALPEMLREEYHAAIGARIEARSGAASKDPKLLDGALCVDLCEHYLKGAQGERALRYLDAAQSHLTTRYLNAQAATLTELALAVPGLLSGAARAKALLQLAVSDGPLDLMGRRARQEQCLRESLFLAEEAGDGDLIRRAAMALGAVLWRASRHAEAEANFRRGLDLARGDTSAEAHALGNLGRVLRSQGRLDEAKEFLERSLALSRDIGDRQAEARETGSLGLVLRSQGHLAEATQCYERSLALSREFRDRPAESRAVGNLATVLRDQGRLAESREFFDRHLLLSREIGDRRSEGAAIGDLGDFLHSQGRLVEAREHFERRLALSREVGDRPGEAGALGDLGGLLFSQGRLVEAKKHFERQLELGRESGDRTSEAVPLYWLADVLREEGATVESEARFAACLALTEETGQRALQAWSQFALGSLRASTRDADAALAALVRARDLARDVGLPVVETLARCEIALLPEGDAQDAITAFAAHEERLRPEEVLYARFLLWRVTGDRAHLVEAKRRLDADLAQAPADCRESILTNLSLPREIAAAAREHGLPLAAGS